MKLLQNQEDLRVPSIESLQDLPAIVTMRDGPVVQLTGYIWRMNQGADFLVPMLINWTLLRDVKSQNNSLPVLSPRALHLVMLYAAGRMIKLKPMSVSRLLGSLLHFARWLVISPEWLPPDRSFDWSDLNEDMFEAWLEVEYKTKSKGYHPAVLRGFYLWGPIRLPGTQTSQSLCRGSLILSV